MASNETSPSLAKGIISRATRRPAELAQVWLGEHNLDSGNSPNESENSITHDRHPAHPWGCSLRCTRRVACHLHSAGSAQPATTCPCRSAVAHAMANSALRLSGGGTGMWRAWIGFNFNH